MGMLVEGKWSDEKYRSDESGRFLRRTSSFRDRITADGSSGFPAERGRYHLYVSWACPWAHRTLILRKLKGLEDAISLCVVGHYMGKDGWELTDEPGAIPDSVNHARFLREVYVKAKPDFTGNVTVPVLWDKKRETIVNNESRDIMRDFDKEFSSVANDELDLCPDDLRKQVDETIDALYEPVNNGVYRAGFAQKQEAYDEAVTELFEALDHWDGLLGRQRYLCGTRLTEADVCLFTTLLRFDLVYHTNFKCNVRKIAEYENLPGFAREIYQLPGVAELCNFDHIKRHYYESHPRVNPLGIVAKGPPLDFDIPHAREHLPKEKASRAG